MNKSGLINNLLAKTDSLSEEDIVQTVNTILNLISNSLSTGNRVELRNFGSFSVRLRKKRLSRNPKTGSSVLVAPKHHPYFRASKHLNESLNK